MTLRETKKLFIQEYYGTKKDYRKARKEDYCKVQFEWSCFMDSLCKNGLVSQKQWNKATF